MSAEQYAWIDATLQDPDVTITYKERECKTLGELWEEDELSIQAGREGS